jgi:hypothetical protein
MFVFIENEQDISFSIICYHSILVILFIFNKTGIFLAPRTIPERNIPERNNPERKNPNLFSGIYVIILNVIIPKRGGKGLS